MNAPLSTDPSHGPWDTEPQRARWLDTSVRFWCLIVRHPTLKHLCGYIGIPLGHPWFGKGYDDIRMADNDWPEVHGGLTYASDHEPGEGRGSKSELWWIGFDCSHCGDLCPGMLRYGSRADRDETYKDWDYVKSECESLARQARQTAKSVENVP